jgi:hypothetical protein
MRTCCACHLYTESSKIHCGMHPFSPWLESVKTLFRFELAHLGRIVGSFLGTKIPVDMWTSCRNALFRRIPRIEKKIKKKGRPDKTATAEAQALVSTVLNQHSYISGHSRRNRKSQRDEQVRILTASKRRIFRDHPELYCHMRERSWYDHCKKYCGEYRPSKKKSDLCDVCLHYDRRTLVKMRDVVKKSRESTLHFMDTYWVDFDKEWLLTAMNPHSTTNPEYLHKLKCYMEKHAGRSFAFVLFSVLRLW